MVPALVPARHAFSYSSRVLCSLLPKIPIHFIGLPCESPLPIPNNSHILAKRAHDFDPHNPRDVVFAVLIPVLVLLSGLFAGLTLGYMSLDETQLKVLSISGTPEQRAYAKKIQPVRKNGHLLLVTLLLCNMIVNETLPVISDQVLGGGIPSVIVSTVLIVIFAEIIPQSLFTRHGLYLGAKMAGFTRCLIFFMGIIAWPVAKLLEFVLGPHHGIIYRRAELKELIAMHSSHATHGGDLKTDTITIIGATLDLQEKVVKQAMTPIDDVFMLDIDSKLDCDLLKNICQTGHSRVPVYEEVEVPVSDLAGTNSVATPKERTRKVKKILGILLVKNCLLLDPKAATPLRKIPLNKVPFVPNNEPLLGILDKFQEGRSHMAIVSRFSVEKAASVKKAVKRGLTQRLRERVMGDSDSSDEEKDDKNSDKDAEELTLKEDGVSEKDDFAEGVPSFGGIRKKKRTATTRGSRKDIEMGIIEGDDATANQEEGKKGGGNLRFQLPKAAAGMALMSTLEQSMPADAVLAKEGAEEFLKNYDPAVMPLGIITLEDVLEELIGEEIYDEFDPQGAHGDPYEVPPKVHDSGMATPVPEQQQPTAASHMPAALHRLGHLGFLRPRSAPPAPRNLEVIPTTSVGEKLAAAASEAVEEHAHGHHVIHPTMEVSPTVQPAPALSSPIMTGGPTPRLAAPTQIPLEAMILGRGRRPASSPGLVSLAGLGLSTSGGGGGEHGRPASVTGKGSKFKSSPLGEEVAVAEQGGGAKEQGGCG